MITNSIHYMTRRTGEERERVPFARVVFQGVTRLGSGSVPSHSLSQKAETQHAIICKHHSTSDHPMHNSSTYSHEDYSPAVT